MGIQFETDYNMETLTAMAKSLRKTVRQKAQPPRAHFCGSRADPRPFDNSCHDRRWRARSARAAS